MKQRSILLLTIVFWTSCLVAQAEKSFSFSMEGQLVATTDGKGLFVNAGGPGLKFHFSKWAISINMMPSLRFQDDRPKPLVTPILGCGPQLYFLKEKRLVLSFPCYYYTNSHVWTFTAGLGYVLTRKTTKHETTK